MEDDQTVTGRDDAIMENFELVADAKLLPRVRIPPPKQSGDATVASKPKPSGNGQSVAVTQPPDDDLDDQSPAKTSLADEMDDEIDF